MQLFFHSFIVSLSALTLFSPFCFSFLAGYVPQNTWYKFGFIFSLIYLAIWGGVGGAWWKVIGLW